MAKSLTPDVAIKLVKENNGGTSKEIVSDGLNRGIIKGTVGGQNGAFVKLYNSNKLPNVERDKQKRSYRYFIKGTQVIHQASPYNSNYGPVTFRPTSEQEELLTALIETKKYSNKSEALQWLISEGIKSKNEDIDKILKAYQEIERLRLDVKKIGSNTNTSKTIVDSIVKEALMRHKGS